jgi:hypothetical protein
MASGRMRAAVAALALLALAACGLFGGREKEREAKPGPLYSPNGEPLSGGPLGDLKCEDAMRRWFARVDADHDGSIDAAEFLADARRQFAAMDLDKSGVLTPSVLARYRAPYLAEQPREEPPDESDSDREKRRQRDREPPIGKDRADPVMIADVNLRNRVTLDDFLASARRNFAALDVNKNGRLSSDEMLATCKPE